MRVGAGCWPARSRMLVLVLTLLLLLLKQSHLASLNDSCQSCQTCTLHSRVRTFPSMWLSGVSLCVRIFCSSSIPRSTTRSISKQEVMAKPAARAAATLPGDSRQRWGWGQARVLVVTASETPGPPRRRCRTTCLSACSTSSGKFLFW